MTLLLSNSRENRVSKSREVSSAGSVCIVDLIVSSSKAFCLYIAVDLFVSCVIIF